MEIDEIIRSRRKTLQITLTQEGRLVVRAPMKLSLARIHEFVSSKERWIIRKRFELQTRQSLVPAEAFGNGDQIMMLGEPVILEYSTQAVRIQLEHGCLTIPEKFRHEAPVRLARWYQDQARLYIGEKLQEASQRTGISYASFRLSGARRRWGSCNSRNALNFSWRLIMAHPRAIEYVILHELCHVVHKNHSRDFWQCVETFMSDFKVWRKWLRDHQQILETC